MGGIGKTQLVRKCIQQNGRSFKNVIWINSEKSESIEDCFKNLASELKIPFENADGKELNRMIEQVVNKLSKSKTLFVYDNVDEKESIAFMLKIEPWGGKPHVIITSRIQEWGDNIDVKQLKIWECDEAITYVSKTLNNQNDYSNDKKSLVRMLQYFPLALRQATAYINYQRKERNFSITDYMLKYDASHMETKKMLDSEINKEDVTNTYAKTTFTTWRITIDAIKQNEATGALACRILNIIAYFDPDNIHRDIFIHLTDTSDNRDVVNFEAAIRSAVRLLINYSMVDGHESQSVLSIHRLVQLVIKLNLKETQQEKENLRDALELISKLIDVDGATLKHSHPHLVSVFMSALHFDDLVKEVSTNVLPSKILTILRDSVKDNQAIAFGNAILEPLERILGKYHEVTLATIHLRAYTYAHLGKHTVAIRKLKDILEQRENMLEKDIVNTKYYLAYSYMRLGKHSDANQMYVEILEQRKNILGEDHLQIINTKNNLAYSYIKLGKYWDAIHLLEVNEEKCENKLGKDHPVTLSNRHDLAYSYTKVGRHSEAIPMFVEVLAKRKTILGEDHPNTLATKRQLACSYAQIGKLFVAIPMFEEILKKRKIILGKDHADTLSVGHDLAYSYAKIGKHSVAIPLFEEVLKKRKIILGDDHPNTLRTKHELTCSYAQIRKLSVAIPMFEEVLEKRKIILGEDHADTLRSKHELACSYAQIGHSNRSCMAGLCKMLRNFRCFACDGHNATSL